MKSGARSLLQQTGIFKINGKIVPSGRGIIAAGKREDIGGMIQGGLQEELSG